MLSRLRAATRVCPTASWISARTSSRTIFVDAPSVPTWSRRLDRSIDLVVAALGILKAGGRICARSIAPVGTIAIHGERRAGSAGRDATGAQRSLADSGVPQVCLDSDTVLIAGSDDAQSAAWPENLAYVIYTSDPQDSRGC